MLSAWNSFFIYALNYLILGEVWETVEPPNGVTIKQVSVGKWSIWVLDNEGKVYVRKEVTSVFPEGTHWQSVVDNLSGNTFEI